MLPFLFLPPLHASPARQQDFDFLLISLSSLAPDLVDPVLIFHKCVYVSFFVFFCAQVSHAAKIRKTHSQNGFFENFEFSIHRARMVKDKKNKYNKYNNNDDEFIQCSDALQIVNATESLTGVTSRM